MSGIEPDTFRMRSERDNQLHHMPMAEVKLYVILTDLTLILTEISFPL